MRKIIELIKNRPPNVKQSFTTFLTRGGDAACVVGAAYLAAGHTYEEFREIANGGNYDWIGEYVESALIAAGVNPNERIRLPASTKGDECMPRLFDALYRMNDTHMMSFSQIVSYLSDEENWYHADTE